MPLAALLRWESKLKPGTWLPTPHVDHALLQQAGRQPIPPEPVGLPEWLGDCQDWEWTTAMVRSVLRHNVLWFDHSYASVEKGDEYVRRAGHSSDEPRRRRGRG